MTKTNPKVSWIHGRNGMYDLHAFQVWGGTAGKRGEDEIPTVYIEGISKRGSVINGGLCVDLEAFQKEVERFLHCMPDDPLVCETCGSANVEIKVWVNVNTNEHGTDCEEDPYCPICDEETRTMQKSDYTYTLDFLFAESGWRVADVRWEKGKPQYAWLHAGEKVWTELPEWVDEAMIAEYLLKHAEKTP